MHVDLVFRAGGVDTPVASLDGTIAKMADLLVGMYQTTFNGEIAADLAGAALPAACGDELVAKLRVTAAASQLYDALWLDVP